MNSIYFWAPIIVVALGLVCGLLVLFNTPEAKRIMKEADDLGKIQDASIAGWKRFAEASTEADNAGVFTSTEPQQPGSYCAEIRPEPCFPWVKSLPLTEEQKVELVDRLNAAARGNNPHLHQWSPLDLPLAKMEEADDKAMREAAFEELSAFTKHLKVAMENVKIPSGVETSVSTVLHLEVYRRAREAAAAVEDSKPEEIWLLPAGGATDDQFRKVAAVIDAEGEKS